MLDALFPPACPLCQVSIPEDHSLCLDCHEALPAQPENFCLRCGEQTVRPESGCGHCLTDPNAPDAVYFAFRYQGTAIDLIVGFKFSDRSERGVVLGKLCWERLGDSLNWEAPDMVIPVPLHAWRLLGRRYNQAALLAGELAWRLDRPLVTNALFRCKMTSPQTTLQAMARLNNVRGAFRVVGKRVQGRSVMLVDDVMTTGATLREAIKMLKKAGASRVVGVCLARVDPDRRMATFTDKGVSHV
ncbi:MAG: ComF family protein [Magnetococcales bacterium]|nr:ComF family protein [Magnetococcales bacterium]MBF0439553.1 ComF family protein [Magnetococcales bacterium]